MRVGGVKSGREPEIQGLPLLEALQQLQKTLTWVKMSQSWHRTENPGTSTARGTAATDESPAEGPKCPHFSLSSEAKQPNQACRMMLQYIATP